MPRLGWTLPLGMAALMLAPEAAWAQAAPPDSAAVTEARKRLGSDLRNFIVSQEGFFADSGTYATALKQMGARYRTTSGVTVVLLTSSGTGHSEVAIDERVPGLVCGTYVGNAPPPFGRGREAEIVCHGP